MKSKLWQKKKKKSFWVAKTWQTKEKQMQNADDVQIPKNSGQLDWHRASNDPINEARTDKSDWIIISYTIFIHQFFTDIFHAQPDPFKKWVSPSIQVSDLVDIFHTEPESCL